MLILYNYKKNLIYLNNEINLIKIKKQSIFGNKNLELLKARNLHFHYDILLEKIFGF